MPRISRSLSLIAAFFLAACGDDEVAPCEIQELEITLTGTIDDQERDPVPVQLSETYDPVLGPPERFEYLAQILGHNAPTPPGKSAVFLVSGPPASSGVLIQLEGSRIAGSTLDILGPVVQWPLPGEGPPISAIPRNALLAGFIADDFNATGADGELEVTRVAPLEGILHAEFSDGAGRIRVVDGQLVVTRTGPGC